MSRLTISTKHFLRLAKNAVIAARRWLNDYGMFGLSAIALLTAGAMAVGAFGFTDQPAPASVDATSTERPLVAVISAPVAPLVLTFYLVASEAQQATMYSIEDRMWNREYLQTSKLEVLVARDREEEEAAYREIEAARVRSSFIRVVVEDLRAR